MDLGIIDPRILVRKALCALLAFAPDVRIVLDVDGALENLPLIQQSQPDVLLIRPARLPSGLAPVPQLKKLLPDIKIILLTDDADQEFELRAIRAGVKGCVSEESEPHVLPEALNAVARGEVWISHRAATRIIGEFARGEVSAERDAPELTQRETEILALMANGYRNKEIASQLFISENTIKTHLLTIYRKLGVSGRMAAAMHYFQRTSSPTRAA
jgi:DNA-binding NarL/FixJ family response regulator